MHYFASNGRRGGVPGDGVFDAIIWFAVVCFSFVSACICIFSGRHRGIYSVVYRYFDHYYHH